MKLVYLLPDAFSDVIPVEQYVPLGDVALIACTSQKPVIWVYNGGAAITKDIRKVRNLLIIFSVSSDTEGAYTCYDTDNYYLGTSVLKIKCKFLHIVYVVMQ